VSSDHKITRLYLVTYFVIKLNELCHIYLSVYSVRQTFHDVTKLQERFESWKVISDTHSESGRAPKMSWVSRGLPPTRHIIMEHFGEEQKLIFYAPLVFVIFTPVDVSLSVCITCLFLFSNMIAANGGSSIGNSLSTRWNLARNWLLHPRQPTHDGVPEPRQPGIAFLLCLTVCLSVSLYASLSLRLCRNWTRSSATAESAHLTSLHRTVQRHVEILNRLGMNQKCDRQTDRRTDGQTKAIVLISTCRSNRERTLTFRRAKCPTHLLYNSEQIRLLNWNRLSLC